MGRTVFFISLGCLISLIGLTVVLTIENINNKNKELDVTLIENCLAAGGIRFEYGVSGGSKHRVCVFKGIGE